MKTMTLEELREILKKHKLWLNEERGGERADFSAVDFIGANFIGANFSGVDFRDANFIGANFSGVDFRDANFIGANFSGVDFSGADFSGVDFSDASFSDASFSGANFSWVDFRGVDFHRVDFSGVVGNGKEIVTMQTDLYMVVFMKNFLQIGCKRYTYKIWRRFSDPEIREMDGDALNFWAKWKEIIFKQAELLGFWKEEQWCDERGIEFDE